MGSRAALSCLLLCILHLLAGAAAWPSYMVMFPYVIYYSHGGKVHIQFMDLDAPVRVTLSLISSHSIPDVILEQMGNSSLQLDWPLFPSNSTPTEEVATVHVVIRGGSLWVSKYREVLLKAPDLWTMIQTDRAAYMRGQTVKFRILCLDEDFMPSDSKLLSVTVHDPSGKSISRWQDVRPRQGITDLSLPLGRDAALGTYTIATEGKNHTFEVQRSWKPRFKVLLQLPSFVMETDEKIPLHVCGRYSSGKPFQGKVEASLCQFHKYLSSSNESARCVVLEGQAERNGCFSTQVSMAAFNLTSSDYARWLFANASLVDEDTGKMKSVTKSCRIFPEMPEDAFRNINGFHNSEMPYAGMDDINFLKIHRMKMTPPCSQPLQIHVDYNFNKKFLGTNLQSVDVFFLILVKETLVTILKKELLVKAALRGSFSLDLPAGPKLVPRATVLCYAMLPEGWTVTDWTVLHIAMCFPNQMKLSFPEQKALTGSQTHLKVQAAPGSLCAIHTVNQHTGNAGLKATFSSNTVYNLRPSSEDSSGPEDEGHEDIECPMGNRPLCSIPLNPYDVFMEFIAPTPKHRVTREEPKHPNERDFCNADTSADLKSVTNTGMDKCMYRYADKLREYEREGVTKPRIWQYVAPQTDLLGPWLWDLIPVGEDGSAEVTVTVPDAVTEWKVGMFCTAPVGLGLAPTATLMAYKAFVLELALPHAVTCGKAFAVAATIFNYLQQCLRVQVMLEDSEDLEVLESADNTDGGCVSGYEARTFRWDVRAISLRKVNVTVTAQALHSKELCGTEVPVVPAQGHTEAVTKLLVVKSSQC